MRALLLSGNFISLQRLSSTGKPDDSNPRETLKTGSVWAGSQGRLDKHIQMEGVHKHNLNAAEAQAGHSFIITGSLIKFTWLIFWMYCVKFHLNRLSEQHILTQFN